MIAEQISHPDAYKLQAKNASDVASPAERLSAICSSLEQTDAHSAYFGPSGFSWLVRGRLGGMPRPGLTRELSADIESLKRCGVTLLVTLTEEWQPPAELIRGWGIESLYLPIQDMAAPTIAEADFLGQTIDSHMTSGGAVVLHCRAGKGRTGTLLASQMLWYEPDHATAVGYVRTVNRSWIESEAQLAFLERYAEHRKQCEQDRPVHAGMSD